ncbi:MAG: isochorismatase family protein [Chthonomonadales bacterium]
MPANHNRHPLLLQPDASVLVVIDLQEPFLRNVWQRGRVVRNAGLLIRGCGILGVPVLPTLQYARRMGGVIPEIAGVLPPRCNPVDKLCFSCAGSADFVGRLERAGRRQVILCGVETHICVCQTALDLVQAGYQVHVAADAVSSRGELNWRLGLKRIEQGGAFTVSTEGVLYELMVRAGTAEFKQIVDLVKEAAPEEGT